MVNVPRLSIKGKTSLDLWRRRRRCMTAKLCVVMNSSSSSWMWTMIGMMMMDWILVKRVLCVKILMVYHVRSLCGVHRSSKPRGVVSKGWKGWRVTLVGLGAWLVCVCCLHYLHCAVSMLILWVWEAVTYKVCRVCFYSICSLYAQCCYVVHQLLLWWECRACICM